MKAPGNRKEEKTHGGSAHYHLAELQEIFNKDVSPDGEVALPIVGGFCFACPRAIIRFESHDMKTTAFLIYGIKLELHGNMLVFEQIMQPFPFSRIRDNHLVNIEYISAFKKADGGSVRMIDDKLIFIEEERLEGFLNFYKKNKHLRRLDPVMAIMLWNFYHQKTLLQKIAELFQKKDGFVQNEL